MSVGHAARRLPAIMLAGAAHCGAILALLALTRAQITPQSPDTSPLLVTFFPPLDSRPDRPAAGTTRASAPPKRGAHPSQSQQAASPQAEPLEPPRAIDWEMQAQEAGGQAADRDGREQRQRKRFEAPQNDAFAPAMKKAEFHWYHARAHRVEPIEGGGTLINLNDNCVLIVIGLIPFPTCTLGTIPARGDLFDHMHDAPELGAWKDR